MSGEKRNGEWRNYSIEEVSKNRKNNKMRGGKCQQEAKEKKKLKLKTKKNEKKKKSKEKKKEKMKTKKGKHIRTQTHTHTYARTVLTVQPYWGVPDTPAGPHDLGTP